MEIEQTLRANSEDAGKQTEKEDWFDEVIQNAPNVATLDFTSLLYRMQEIHDAKGTDYEAGGKPYENHRAVEEIGIPAWKYPVARMFEKFARLKSYCTKGSLAVKDESYEDSLFDIANLALIAIILHRERNNGRTEDNKDEMSSVQKFASGVVRSYLADNEGKPFLERASQ